MHSHADNNSPLDEDNCLQEYIPRLEDVRLVARPVTETAPFSPLDSSSKLFSYAFFDDVLY